MNFKDILDSMYNNEINLEDKDISILTSKYEKIRKCIDDNLDHFCKLCALNSYAQDVANGVYKTNSNIGSIANSLTEEIDNYVYYTFCEESHK